MTAPHIQHMCDQALALHQAGRIPEAERIYNQVRAADPRNFTASYLLGVIQHSRGENARALASIEAALSVNPNMAPALLYHGLLLEAHGRDAPAMASYNRAIALQPDLVEAMVNRGALLERMGRSNDALADFESALSLRPDFVPALFNRATTLQSLGRHEEALSVFDRTLKLAPDHIQAVGNRGSALRALKRYTEALAAFEYVVAREPNNALAQYNRGVAMMDLGRAADALTSFDRALALAPDFALAHGNRATALTALGRADEALAAYDRAPQDFATLSEKGELLHDLQLFPQSLAAYDAALALQADATITNNRGGVLQNLGRMSEARAAYDAALVLEPDHLQALTNRALIAWQHFDDRDAAIADLERVVKQDPAHDYSLGLLLHLRMQSGDWRDYRPLLAQVESGVRAGKTVARPFIFQALSASPADLRTCSQIYTARRYPPMPAIWRPRQHQKIKLGYVCGEFREQATTFLAAGLFERHDKERFELFAFDNGSNDNSGMRTRLEQSFDHFVPITALNDQAAAQAIARHEIDILVSLNGYFGQNRMGVFAHKPAPLQVNYLGFPATLGAPYIDYIIADKIVVPESETPFYNEKLAWLPGSYQVNDDRRTIGGATSRAAHNLPEDAFVYCNFNHSYKLTPDTFDTWLRILTAVPGSVLWLWDSNPRFAVNLRAYAQARGVDASRLIFAGTAAHADHLARLQLADLALDSLPYNAHTTGSDALWAGLPLLTCRGTAFPGRVAASLLNAVGLPELITENIADFEARAIALAIGKDELAGLRAKLAANRTTTLLFDTARYTRHIEQAYQTMWEKFQRGEAPSAFTVEN